MSKDYSLARKQQEVQRVEATRRESYSGAYRTAQRIVAGKYTAPHEEDIGKRGIRVGGFVDIIF